MFTGTICSILPDAGLEPNLCCYGDDKNEIYIKGSVESEGLTPFWGNGALY
jgi:hypothetical protein